MGRIEGMVETLLARFSPPAELAVRARAEAAVKIFGQIAGQANVEVTQQEIDAYAAAQDAEGEDNGLDEKYCCFCCFTASINILLSTSLYFNISSAIVSSY